jgi:hypothetical protein
MKQSGIEFGADEFSHFLLSVGRASGNCQESKMQKVFAFLDTEY